MSKTQSQNVEQLSRELARIADLRLRPPRAGEQGASVAGLLHSLLPPEFFHWRKCPVHGTWLQPELKPFQHWRCMAWEKEQEDELGHREAPHCTFSRPAKFRTHIERRIFAVAAFLEEHA